MPGRSRRARAVGGRPHRVLVDLSDLEMAQVAAAAARAGLARGAWLGEVGVGSAAAEVTPGPTGTGQEMQALMTLRAELMEDRRILRNVGGNLNDVARHANASSELHTATGSVIELVQRAVARIDGTVSSVDRQVAEARRARLRGAK